MADFIGRVHWERIPARERDALSIAYVMRKRKGKKTVDAARAMPALLTRNAALADISLRFCKENRLIDERDIGPAVHQRQMASILWMAFGSEERKEFARRDLVQRCSNVVRLRPDIVEKTRQKIRQIDLDKSRQFEALISRSAATQIMMDVTLGAERVVTSENIEEIFQSARASAAEDVRQKHMQKSAEERKKYNAQIVQNDKKYQIKKQINRDPAQIRNTRGEITDPGGRT